MPYKVETIIEKVKVKVAAAANDANRTIFSIFEFTITDGGKVVKVYTIDLKDLQVYEGKAKGACDVKVTVTDDALDQLLKKEVTLDQATKAGNITVDGDEDGIAKMKLLTQKLIEP